MERDHMYQLAELLGLLIKKNKWLNSDFKIAHLLGSSLSAWSLAELEFGNVGFWKEGKAWVSKKNLV